MKHNLLLLLIFLAGTFSSTTLKSQGIEELVKNRYLGAYDKKITIERKPAPLPGVREADVTWSKIVWRLVDMREKMNQVFYFPTREIQGRNNLVNLLLKGIKENTVTAFDAHPQDDYEFLTPISYEDIKKRVKLAAEGDFVISLYNPKSKGRPEYLRECIDIIKEFRAESTPIAVVRHALREGQSYKLFTIKDFDTEIVDMMSIVIIGNSKSYYKDGKFITPRGYENKR